MVEPETYHYDAYYQENERCKRWEAAWMEKSENQGYIAPELVMTD